MNLSLQMRMNLCESSLQGVRNLILKAEVGVKDRDIIKLSE